jgi:glycosyltransferase involved in cell wall biosynthesis
MGVILMEPLVSVVIPFYNCPYIDQAIDSVLNQTYPNIEIILVNDGSTQFLDKLEPYMENIRYIEKENGGTATALNVGIKSSFGEYFAWLSADDIFKHDKISKQINLLLSNNGYFCNTSYSLINTKNQITSILQGFNFPKKIYLANTLIKGCIINGSTVMINMDVFRSIGNFDESLRYTHDYDLWLRMLPHYEFDYIHEDLLLYRIHDEMGSKKNVKQIEKEIKLVQKKHRQSITDLSTLLSKDNSNI